MKNETLNGWTVLVPTQVLFCLDTDFHTVSIANEFKNKTWDMAGRLRCIIAPTKEEAEDVLREAARKWAQELAPVVQGRIRLQDFILHFYEDRVDNGQFFPCQRRQSFYLNSPL